VLGLEDEHRHRLALDVVRDSVEPAADADRDLARDELDDVVVEAVALRDVQEVGDEAVGQASAEAARIHHDDVVRRAGRQSRRGRRN